MKKKSIVLLITLAILAGLVGGCGNKEKTKTEAVSGVHTVSKEVPKEEVVEEPADTSFGGYDNDVAYTYNHDIDTMLPPMDEPIISLDELYEDYGYDDYWETEEAETNFTDAFMEYMYKSKLDYYLILDDDTVFVLGDDYDEVELPYGWELYPYNENFSKYDLYAPGQTWYAYATDGYAEVELGFFNPEYAYNEYDDCRFKSISVQAWPWMDYDEVVYAETVGGIGFGDDFYTVDRIMKKYGFTYDKWNDDDMDIVHYVECLDPYNQRDEVGRYTFGFDSGYLCSISIEYVGKK